MKSTVHKEILASPSAQAQPRLQRNALNLFEILSSNLAVLAPAEGIFLSIGLAVAFLGSRAPWAFLIAAVAILTIGNTLSEFSRVRPSAGSFISLLGNSLQGYSPKLAVFVSTTCIMLLQLSYPIALSATVVFLGSWVNSFVPALNWMLVAVAAVVLITPLVLRGVVVPTIWMAARYVSGVPTMNAASEMPAVDWFSWDALPEPLFSPFEKLLTGICYPALWDFSGEERA